MSYCRPGPDCDVYAWSDGEMFFIQADSLNALRAYLLAILHAGYAVPSETFDRIDRELREAATAPEGAKLKAEKEQGE